MLSPDELDAILALQFSVAWAGERADSRNPRLGWWHTDVIDAAGGGDFLARLLPKTHAWAALELAREAARRVDYEARRGYAKPDAMRTLFFLGGEIDWQLAERLLEQKRTRCDDSKGPVPLPQHVLAGLSTSTLHELRAQVAAEPGYPGFDVAVGGRQLRGTWPQSAVLGVQHLTHALFTTPLPAAYPLAFYPLHGGA